MKRFATAPNSVLALVAALLTTFACACTAEEATRERESEREQGAEGERIVDLGDDGYGVNGSGAADATGTKGVGRANTHLQAQPSAPDCDFADRWDSIEGPVPDPWRNKPPPDPPPETGSGQPRP